jgi:phage regulator Rha-like protein
VVDKFPAVVNESHKAENNFKAVVNEFPAVVNEFPMVGHELRVVVNHFTFHISHFTAHIIHHFFLLAAALLMNAQKISDYLKIRNLTISFKKCTFVIHYMTQPMNIEH